MRTKTSDSGRAYLRLLARLSILGESHGGGDGAIKETYGAGLGYLIPVGVQSKLGVEFTLELTPRHFEE